MVSFGGRLAFDLDSSIVPAFPSFLLFLERTEVVLQFLFLLFSLILASALRHDPSSEALGIGFYEKLSLFSVTKIFERVHSPPPNPPKARVRRTIFPEIAGACPSVRGAPLKSRFDPILGPLFSLLHQWVSDTISLACP